MQTDQTKRVKTGIICLLLIIAWGVGSVVANALEARGKRLEAARKQGLDEAVDWITAYEKRFDGLKTTLPPESVAGYLTDQPASPGRDFLVTQYALCPVVMKRGVTEPVVVGNFHNARAMQQILMKEGLQPIRDFRNGVVLFKGRSDACTP